MRKAIQAVILAPESAERKTLDEILKNIGFNAGQCSNINKISINHSTANDQYFNLCLGQNRTA